MCRSNVGHKLLIAGLMTLFASWIMLPQNSFAASNQKDWHDVTDQYVGYSKIWSDRDTAIANGSDTIKIMGELYMVGPDCPDPATPCYQAPASSAYRISVSGTGNSVSPQEIKSGNVVFNITSTTAETKTITMQNEGAYGSWGSDISIQVSFTSPPSAASATSSTSTSSSSLSSSRNNATASAPTKTKLEAPAISAINNQQLPDSKTLTQEITAGDPITFTGKTVPNAKVVLYIYSDPITAETTSDKDGLWSYTLTNSLEVGQHRVEAEVTDSDGKTSDKVEIAKFSVNAKPDEALPVSSTSSTPPQSSIFTPLNYALASSAIILIGVLIFLVYKRKKRSRNLVQ